MIIKKVFIVVISKEYHPYAVSIKTYKFLCSGHFYRYPMDQTVLRSRVFQFRVAVWLTVAVIMVYYSRVSRSGGRYTFLWIYIDMLIFRCNREPETQINIVAKFNVLKAKSMSLLFFY